MNGIKVKQKPKATDDADCDYQHASYSMNVSVRHTRNSQQIDSNLPGSVPTKCPGLYSS
jgi:hypothetical protein